MDTVLRTHLGQFAPADRENPHKAANQLRKAKVLAEVLRKVGATPNDVDSPTVRRLAEDVTGFERFAGSSDTTWALVAVLLED